MIIQEGFTETIIPETTIRKCNNCKYHSFEHDWIEDGNDYDSWFNHFCNHSSFDNKRKYIGENDETPNWCPFLTKK